MFGNRIAGHTQFAGNRLFGHVIKTMQNENLARPVGQSLNHGSQILDRLQPIQIRSGIFMAILNRARGKGFDQMGTARVAAQAVNGVIAQHAAQESQRLPHPGGLWPIQQISADLMHNVASKISIAEPPPYIFDQIVVMTDQAGDQSVGPWLGGFHEICGMQGAATVCWP